MSYATMHPAFYSRLLEIPSLTALYRDYSMTVNLSLVLTLWFTGFLVYRLFFHPLAGIPGPFICKITGLWRTYRYFNMTWHDDIVNLHRAYGPVVRIAPNEASIVDAGAQKKLYSHGSKARKTSWYDTWSTSVPVPVFFSETDTKIHGALRRRVSAAFSMSSILKYEKYVQSCLDVCYGKIRKHAEAGRIIDMSEWTHMLTFDIVGELTFGQALGQMETETDLDDVRKTNTSDIYWAGNLGHMWLQSRWVNNLVVEWLNAGSPAARFSAWVFEKVIMRKEGRDGSDREDMLSHFLKMKPLGTNKALEDIEVVVESANVVFVSSLSTKPQYL